MRFREFGYLREADDGVFTVEVPPGIKNPQVADIQKALVGLGYPLPRHGVDGIRGPETSGAIAKFQSDNGITATGIPDANTVNKFNSILSTKPELLKTLTKSTMADVKTRSVGTGAVLPPVVYDAVTKGKIGKILNMIAGPESSGYYDIMQGGKRVPEILNMTLSQLLQYQRAGGAGGETAAAGRYQFMPNTLEGVASAMGLDFNKTTFSPQTQDNLAIYKLRQRGLDKWLSGDLEDAAFMDQLAMEWAAFPSPTKGGLSWYHGVGSNRAGLSLDSVFAALDDIKGTEV